MTDRETVERRLRTGETTHAVAQTELLLDIRDLLAQVQAQTRKPGRPRKKRAKPAGG